MKRLIPYLIAILGLVLFGLALAQDPVPTDPSTWFASPETVMAIGVILAGWVVNVLTALGKAAWLTTGSRTVILSVGISVIVAGIGGYLALGYYSDLGGLPGALRAAAMVLIAAVIANGKHKADVQVATKAATKAKLLK